MSNDDTEKILAGYVAKFGPQDGPIVAHLTGKVSSLAQQWRVFLYLFSGPKERVDTLNEASGFMARMIQNLIWDNVLMRIRQLTDPQKTRFDDNLSLEHLVRIAAVAETKDLLHDLETVKDVCSTTRAYATKHLAHLDLGHALGDAKTQVSRGQTTDAIRAICKFVQAFHLSTTHVDYGLMPEMLAEDDEQQFLLRLYQGNAAEKAFEASVQEAVARHDWQGAERQDMPEWIWDQGNQRNFLNGT